MTKKLAPPTVGIIFSFLLKICIHYFPTGSFQVPTKKNHPHNLSHSYMNVLKNGSAHPPPSFSSPWPTGGGCQLWSFIYIWLILKFSICKCFCNCRKHHFRLLLGGFLALPNSPKYIGNFVLNFDQWFNTRQCIRYVTAFIVLLRNGQN